MSAPHVSSYRKLLVAAVLIMPFAAALSACNTVEGAGKDIQATGDVISDTARDTKQEITQ